MRERVSRGARSAARQGFSLLEVLLTVSIFGIAMAGLTSSQLTAIALSRTNRDQSLAMDAAQSVLEALEDEPEEEFARIFLRWNSVPGDDPLTGDSPGSAFDVPGLEPLRDDPDGRVGEILFPGGSEVLREDVNDRLLGMPRDLNLDGDDDDVAPDYRILPVLVRVRWRGPGGAQQIQLVGTLAPR